MAVLDDEKQSIGIGCVTDLPHWPHPITLARVRRIARLIWCVHIRSACSWVAYRTGRTLPSRTSTSRRQLSASTRPRQSPIKDVTCAGETCGCGTVSVNQRSVVKLTTLLPLRWSSETSRGDVASGWNPVPGPGLLGSSWVVIFFIESGGFRTFGPQISASLETPDVSRLVIGSKWPIGGFQTKPSHFNNPGKVNPIMMKLGLWTGKIGAPPKDRTVTLVKKMLIWKSAVSIQYFSICKSLG